MNKLVNDLLNITDELFTRIRGDWTDPRWECRTGWECVKHLRTALSDNPNSLELAKAEDFVAKWNEGE